MKMIGERKREETFFDGMEEEEEKKKKTSDEPSEVDFQIVRIGWK